MKTTTKRFTKAASMVFKPQTLIIVSLSLFLIHARGDSCPADNYPRTLNELNSWYVEPPEGQNAATYYLTGLKYYDVTDSEKASNDIPFIGKGAIPEPGQPLTSASKAALSAIIQRNQQLFASFQKAMRFEKARYPIDLRKGSLTLLPHLAKLKGAIQLGELDVLLLASERKGKEAVDEVLCSLAASESLKLEPVLLSQLVRTAGAKMQKNNLERVFNLMVIKPEDLSRLSRAFEKADEEESDGTGYSRAYAGEMANDISLFELPPENYNAAAKKLGASDADHQAEFIKETFYKILSDRKAPLPDRLYNASKHFNARVNEAKSKDYAFCNLLLPEIRNTFAKEAETVVVLRLSVTAIALERFRAANGGKYPENLLALTPAFLSSVPMDPFDGKPLRYEKIGLGYKLHSIGSDGPDSTGSNPNSKSWFVVTKGP